MQDNASNILQLTERESNYLKFAVELYEIKFYCAAAMKTLKNKPIGSYSLARLLQPRLLKQNFAPNTRYCQCSYQTETIIAAIDCMGNTATKFNDIITDIDVKLFIYANGRNVFDTFVNSRFGQNTAEFASSDKTVDVLMRYYPIGNYEVRNITLTNKGKSTRKFSVEIPVKTRNAEQYDYFNMDNALCLASKDESLYVGCAIVYDNAIIQSYGTTALNYDFIIESNSSINFDIVTAYSHNAPELTNLLTDLYYYSATKCPYAIDKASDKIRWTDITLNLTSRGYV